MFALRRITTPLTLGLGLLGVTLLPFPALQEPGSSLAVAETLQNESREIILPADALATGATSAPSFAPSGAVGVDVSFPQCNSLNVPLTASNGAPYSFAIIG